MTALPARLTEDWTGLLQLLGDRALMLHAPEPDSELSGGDYDCVVLNLDPTWPLRLTGGWSLCQRVHYDLLGWYWVLERDGESFALDTATDMNGLGIDGFPMKLFLHGNDVPPALRGAYLAAKRIYKGMLDVPEWQRIGALARTDEAAFFEALNAVLGARLSHLIGNSALRGQPPEPRLLRRAARSQRLRRFRTPSRAAQACVLALRRTAERVAHPTGLIVLVAGPDGAGKSTLAAQLPELCRGLFRRHTHLHWRPGLLPRPGSFLGREGADATEPHAREPHGRAVSSVLLVYYWIDFLVGGWVRLAVPRVRSSLVVVERGWWDIEADARRYRLDPPPWLVRLLGHTLSRPDVALILEGSAQALLDRKREIPLEELERQLAYWHSASIAKLSTGHLDTEHPLPVVATDAQSVIVSALERRAASRLGVGWVNLPRRHATRWYLPRGSRRTAVAALSVYQPVTRRARAGWGTAHVFARAGGFKMLPRGEAPPREVREVLAPYIPAHGNVAVVRTTHPNRYVAAVIDRDGVPMLVAKVASDIEGVRSLANEVSAIEQIAPLLGAPLSAPVIVAHSSGLVVFEFVPWLPRKDPTVLTEEVAFALGRFYAGSDSNNGHGAAHGDFAPWNILKTADGWTLLDWEAASLRGRPFADLCHYFVQSHSLLGRPSPAAIVDGFRRGTGEIATAIRAYADGAKVGKDLAASSLHAYLMTSSQSLLPEDRDRGTRTRDRLRRRLER